MSRQGDMPVTAEDALGYFRLSNQRQLLVEPEHAVAVEALPAHHANPFHRLLVALALVEPMRLMTHDPLVARYSDTVIQA